MRIAVVVVSYNTRDLLRQCLASVQDSVAASGIDAGDVSVVVVDNASIDQSAEMVRRDFPHVSLIEQHENLGFARANNVALASLGFRVAGHIVPAAVDPPDCVLLLNPDAQLMGDALGCMASFLQDRKDAGACGARLQYGNGSFQHGAFRFPSLRQVALDLFPMEGLPGAQRIYGSRFNGRYPSQLWNGSEPFAVDFVLGASLMMDSGAIDKIGGLDEGYFMYCEEMDWCLRLARVGLTTYAVPDARVIHHEAQSSRQMAWPSFCRLWQSRFRFYTKHRAHFPPGNLALVRLLTRAVLRMRSRQMRRRFARGQTTGTEAAAALEAYAFVARL